MAAGLLTTPMEALAHPQSHTQRTEGVKWLVGVQTAGEPRFYFIFNSEPHSSLHYLHGGSQTCAGPSKAGRKEVILKCFKLWEVLRS